jgi:thiol:disulfide interchange protein DsbA
MIMTVVLATLQPCVSHAQAAQSPLYQTLATPVPPDEVGKVEILEFFTYSCSHCAAMAVVVDKWKKTLPAGVVFKSVPVAFSAAMRPLQQLYYTIETLHRPDLHAKVFTAIQAENKRLFDKEAMHKWIATQGVDPAKFDAIFDSFAVRMEVERASQLTQLYQIDGTPSYAVGGKYMTSPAMTGSYQGALDEIDKLLPRVRAAS